MINKLPEFFPNIDDYNTQNYDSQPVSLENLDYLIYKIVARTGLTYDQASIIVKLYFNEIRTQILNGENVNIVNFGKFNLKIKTNKRNKVSLHLKFKASSRFLKKIRYNAIFRK